MFKSDFRLDRKEILIILIILLIAIGFRLFYFIDYQKTDIYPVLTYSDGYYYNLWARDIANGDIWGNRVFMKWPLYAYFLGFLFFLSKNSIFSAYITQFLLGAINCLLVYCIARIIYNRFIALFSALLCIGYGFFIFYDGLLTYTSLSLFLNSLLFLLLLLIRNRPTKNRLFWTGVFLGACALAQGNIIIFGVLAVIWILSQERNHLREFAYKFFAFTCGLAFVIGAVTLRNYLIEKKFVLIAGNMGIAFYVGNNPTANGLFYCPDGIAPNQEGMFRDSRVIAKVVYNKDLKTSEVSGFWFKKAMDFISHNRIAYVKLLLNKAVYLLSPQEYTHDVEYIDIKDKIRAFRFLFLNLKFILPLGVLGAFLGLRRFKETALLYIILFSLSSSMLLFFISTRYRITLVPFLAIFAASAIFSIWSSLRKKEYLKFGLLLLASIMSYLLFNYGNLFKASPVSLDSVSARFNKHFRSAVAYKEKSDYQNAIPEAVAAYYLQPNNPRILFLMGEINFQTGDLRLAENNFQEVLKIAPASVDAYYNLGLIYSKEKRYDEAEAALIKAVSLDPQDAAAHFELARVYKAKGKAQKAKKEFEITLEKINHWRIDEIEIIKRELESLER